MFLRLNNETIMWLILEWWPEPEIIVSQTKIKGRRLLNDIDNNQAIDFEIFLYCYITLI